ncbi:MAG: ATP-binding protein, partial [Burkholderiaceae bacterium]
RLSNGGPAPDFDWQAIGEILSAVIERARLRDDTVDLRLKLEASLPLIRGDGVLLAQAVANLVDNALKYSKGAIVVSASLHNAQLNIDVADRGSTLSAHERQRIFQTFYRSPNALGTRGAGLGLSIAQAVAQAHGGGLSVMPRLDGGNIFRLSLQLAEVPPVAAETADEAEAVHESGEGDQASIHSLRNTS